MPTVRSLLLLISRQATHQHHLHKAFGREVLLPRRADLGNWSAL